jgi:hypothetical protein
VGRRLGPQVLQLLRRGGTTEYLVAVRVAPKALYDATGSLGLRDPKLGHRPQVGLGVGCFLLSVLNATLVEGEVLGVAQRQPEKVSLYGSQLAVHPQVDAFEGQLEGFLVL